MNPLQRIAAVAGLVLVLFFALQLALPDGGCGAPLVDALRRRPELSSAANEFDASFEDSRRYGLEGAQRRQTRDACISSARDDVTRTLVILAFVAVGTAASMRILRSQDSR